MSFIFKRFLPTCAILLCKQGTKFIYGAYKLVASYILEDDEADEHYNADTVLTLKSMPNISIQLQEIFENVE